MGLASLLDAVCKFLDVIEATVSLFVQLAGRLRRVHRLGGCIVGDSKLCVLLCDQKIAEVRCLEILFNRELFVHEEDPRAVALARAHLAPR